MNKSFKIKIIETLSRDFVIEAKNKSEALQKAKDLYLNCKIILDSADFDNYKIQVKENKKNIDI